MEIPETSLYCNYYLIISTTVKGFSLNSIIARIWMFCGHLQSMTPGGPDSFFSGLCAFASFDNVWTQARGCPAGVPQHPVTDAISRWPWTEMWSKWLGKVGMPPTRRCTMLREGVESQKSQLFNFISLSIHQNTFCRYAAPITIPWNGVL